MNNTLLIHAQPKVDAVQSADNRAPHDELTECFVGIRHLTPDTKLIDVDFKLPDDSKSRVIYDERGSERRLLVNLDGQKEVEAEERFKGTWRDGEIEVMFPDLDSNVLAELRINGSTEITFHKDGNAHIKGAILIRKDGEANKVEEI